MIPLCSRFSFVHAVSKLLSPIEAFQDTHVPAIQPYWPTDSVYAYNFLGLSEYKVAAAKPLPEGNVTIRYEFIYDGGGPGKGGKGSIFVNGEQRGRPD